MGLSSLFFQHLQPRFDRSQLTDTVISVQLERIITPYWGSWAEKFVSTKREEREIYDRQLRRVVGTNVEKPATGDL